VEFIFGGRLPHHPGCQHWKKGRQQEVHSAESVLELFHRKL